MVHSDHVEYLCFHSSCKSSNLFNSFVEVKEHDDKEAKTSQPMLINYFLSILLNLIKFNSAYLDADVVSAIITNISEICILDDNIEENIVACLQVIENYLTC